MSNKTEIPGVWSDEDAYGVYKRVVRLTNGGGQTAVRLHSRRIGTARWVRNRLSLAGDTQAVTVTITRRINDSDASITTTCTDDVGLREAVQRAETAARVVEARHDNFLFDAPLLPMLRPMLWSEHTVQETGASRAATAAKMMASAEAAGCLSAGTLQTTMDSHMTMTEKGIRRFYPETTVECSLTVRNPQKNASGWAGVNHYDIAKIDPQALAAIALEKCQQSASPQKIEPGRYTVILESQAMADLFAPLIGGPPGSENNLMSRPIAEMGIGPFGRPGGSRIGEYVIDRRLNVRSDPMDPDGGFVPFEEQSGEPYQPVNWIDQGMLKELAYMYGYGVTRLNRGEGLPCPNSYRLTAAPGVPTANVAEMIAKTERGILVTRLYDVKVVFDPSVLCTGYTRDGVWFIEHGKIVRPVTNFRFRESPLYVLNNLLDVGVPIRVYAPGKSWVVPAIRAKDFLFVGTADAV